MGAEGGFLPAPVQLDRLLMFVAERSDVIVDFSRVRPGTELFLINEGPDEPFGGGEPGTDFDAANPQTTGQVMKFVVVPASSTDRSVPPDRLDLPRFTGVPTANRVRRLSLNEDDSATLEGVGPRAGLLGTLDAAGNPVEHPWMDDVTEKPAFGTTERWELYNFTEDAHPIHVHLVQFQVDSRQQLATDADGVSAAPVQLVGKPTPPEPWERGTKDTLIAYPGQVTRLRATFDIRGRFVWHCHIVSHEDNEMMRPYTVG
jgi:bilirubin oxidase